MVAGYGVELILSGLHPNWWGWVHALLCGGTERRLRHFILSPNTHRWRALRNLGRLRLSGAAAGGRMRIAGMSAENRCSRGTAGAKGGAGGSSKTKVQGRDRQDGEVNDGGYKD